MNYSNEKTRYLYETRAIKFLNNIYKITKEEPMELTQNMLDDYVIWLNKSKNQNPFHRGFIRAFRLCFDQDENIYRLKTKLDRSRARTSLEEYDWLEKKDIDTLIEKGSPYISLMIRIYFDTGRRLAEVMDCDLTSKEWDLDLVKSKRTLRGVAKGNAEFRSHFSKETAKKIYEWIKSSNCVNKNKPFMLIKKNGEPYGNPHSALDYEFKKECKYLGIRTTNGGEPHIHCIRHSLGRYLTQEKGWKIEQTAVKLGHKKLDNTKKYASPSIEQIEQKEDMEIFDK
jgi:integrase